MAIEEVRPHSEVECDVVAYHYRGMEVKQWTAADNCPGTGIIGAVSSLPLVIDEPGWVQFADRYYRLDSEGLYRFWNWGSVFSDNPDDLPTVVDEEREYGSVILYQGDLRTLLSSLMLIHVHGYAHQELPFAEQLCQAKLGHLSLTCGYVAQFACDFLKTVGVDARRVAGLRKEGRYNTYDNGHTLNEVFWPELRKWVLIDIDLHQMFLDRDGGTYLSLAEVSDLINRGEDFYLEPLTPPGMGGVDTSPSVDGDFSGQLMLEGVVLHPDLLREWYRKTLSVPLIIAPDAWYFYCEQPHDSARVSRYSPSYKSVSRDQWMTRFYSTER